MGEVGLREAPTDLRSASRRGAAVVAAASGPSAAGASATSGALAGFECGAAARAEEAAAGGASGVAGWGRGRPLRALVAAPQHSGSDPGPQV